jgi:hypothetical protein
MEEKKRRNKMVINGVRLKTEDIVSYKHVYEPCQATPFGCMGKEHSYVEVTFKDGAKAVIMPCDEKHSDQQ